MTNAEKYREEIENYKGDNLCRDFIRPIVLKGKGLSCGGIDCGRCHMLQMLWLMDKYEEPKLDWSKVAVDTPVLVRDYEQDKWERGYFAEYTDGCVFAWKDGRTFWTSNGVARGWLYAKLAEEGDQE